MQDLDDIMTMHWADKIAANLVRQNPAQKKFVCAAGISPSGVVHIGNFRDLITSDLVCRALQDKGYRAELIFSWDSYDKLRKVPKGVPDSFARYLGKPLVEVPDPQPCKHDSYSAHFQEPFEESLPQVGVRPRFIQQADMYRKNAYYEGIKIAMQKKEQIAKILAEFKTQGMSEEQIGNYFPLQVYCPKCGSGASTKITAYDGEDKVSFFCGCGHKETADISKKNIGKLDWKVDWPMRWKYEGVSFEPGGSDHATPGGSYDVSSRIAREVFGIEPPMFKGYAFVGVEGAAKMSGSKGSGISLGDMLQIYEPELLRWLFTRISPEKAITLFFGSHIIKQYDEFDREAEKYQSGKLSAVDRRSMEFAMVNPKHPSTKGKKVPFRQVASFGQIAQGNMPALMDMFRKIGQEFDEEALRTRLDKSQAWITNFNPELAINLRDSPNFEYYRGLGREERQQVEKLRDEIDEHWDLERLTHFVYGIPKRPGMSEDEKKEKQRAFFRDVYQMLVGADTGPRLPTFLLALGKEKVKKLLKAE